MPRTLSKPAPALLSLLLIACIPSGGRSPAPGAQAPGAPPRLDLDIVGLIEREPVWAAQQVVPGARTVSGSTYVVQPGDTLRGIGNRTGAGSEVIAKVNGLVPPYMIRPGQKLTIPAGRYHLVAEGETGIAIAMAYGVEWSRIVDLNGLEAPFTLRRGQRLLLPSDTPARPPSIEERAAAFRIDIDDVLTGGQPATAEGAAIAAATTAAKPLPSSMPIAEPTAFSGTFTWPLSGPVLSRFGPGASGEKNNGIDIGTANGTPIQAAADGVVAYAGDQVAVFGGLILITHGGGWVTAYGHAGRVDVVRGQKIHRGQVIGLSGDTGYASQPKLHFEIRKGREPVNPLSYLPARR